MQTIANNIITKFGGAYRLAEILGVDVSQVYRWTYDKARGGADGKIPARHFNKILIAAKERNINIALEELILIPKSKNKTRSN